MENRENANIWQTTDGSCTLYLDDCFHILQALPDKSIDLILTDPPSTVFS